MTSARGSISLVVVTGSLVLCLTALAAADLGSLVVARARAQAAADAAALAAVVAQVPVLGRSEDPEAAARAVAEANGATLVACQCTEGEVESQVEVTVPARVTVMAPWAGRTIRAVARAEVDPDVLSYRDDG